MVLSLRASRLRVLLAPNLNRTGGYCSEIGWGFFGRRQRIR
jgi:hypothetical protein